LDELPISHITPAAYICGLSDVKRRLLALVRALASLVDAQPVALHLAEAFVEARLGVTAARVKDLRA